MHKRETHHSPKRSESVHHNLLDLGKKYKGKTRETIITSVDLLAKIMKRETCNSPKRPDSVHHILLDLKKYLEKQEKMLSLR